MDNDRPRVKATETSFRIIEALRDDGGAGVSQLSREVDISKSAVYKHVQTLTRLGYLYREGDGYHLSNKFLGLGSRAGDRLPLNTARSVVVNLAEATGHTSNFIAHENDRGVYVLRIDPNDNAETDIAEGDVAPLHASAGGKAILAFLPTDERTTILEESGLPEYTGKTITDRRELERELRSIRDQRVAFDREEYIEGHQCVASPVIGNEGEPVGAVSVSGDVSQMSGKRLEEDVTGLVTSAANSIETNLLS